MAIPIKPCPLAFSLILGLSLSPISFLSPVVAQVPANGVNIPTIDELPGDTTQIRTWRCSQASRAIAVEAKAIRWRSEIETNGWSCLEDLSGIPNNKQQFSCESDANDLGLITVTWLTGKDAKKQMKAWLNEFSANPSLVCTIDKTSPFWQ